MDMNEHDFYIRISSSTAGSTTSQPRTENTAESRTGTPHTNTDSAAHHLTCMLQLSMASQYFIPVISACNTAKRACTHAKIVVSESTTIILMHCEQRVFTWAAECAEQTSFHHAPIWLVWSCTDMEYTADATIVISVKQHTCTQLCINSTTPNPETKQAASPQAVRQIHEVPLSLPHTKHVMSTWRKIVYMWQENYR